MSETSAPARTDWSARAVGRAALTPEKLAGKVEAVLDRCDRVLFTTTPREELDTAAQWQRLADEAWCGQVRHIVATTARLSAEDRDFAGDELALALGVSSTTGRMLVWSAGSLAALPGLIEAVESGRITSRHAKALVGALDALSLDLEQRQAIALIALARYVDQTPGEWAAMVRRLALTVDPQAARRRKEERTAERRVAFYPRAHEQGAMWLEAPVEQVARAEARVTAEARRLKAAGDPRTMDQLLCDVTLQLLADGRLGEQPVAPYEVQVVVPLSVLEGSEDEVVELPGWGAVSAETGRELARQGRTFSQVAVDGEGRVVNLGDPVRADRLARKPEEADRLLAAAQAMRAPAPSRDLSSSGYVPSPRLVRFLEARDRTCVFPGCGRQAARTDKDHRVPWPRGGTTADNLQCVCRHHHRAKHAVFTVELADDGSVLWVTRGGWVFHRRPKGL